jgi:hypothetical protein
MFRPVTITHPVVVNDGKPFDACKGFLTARKTEESVTNEELELAQCIVIFQHAKAMNPPIEVTDAVLKAMEKVPEAKFSILNKDFYIVTSRYGSLPIFKDRVDNKWFYYYDGLIELKIGDYVQADCPLALQVLLQFTVEGVPKDD